MYPMITKTDKAERWRKQSDEIDSKTRLSLSMARKRTQSDIHAQSSEVIFL